MRSLLIILFSAFALISCSDDTTNPPVDNTSSANSFNVNGNGYSNASFKGYIADSASTAVEDGSDLGVIAFSGEGNKSGEVFAISLSMNNPKVGKHTIDPSQGVNVALVTVNSGTTATYMAVTGEIDVKSWDVVGGRAKGTFNCNAVLTPGGTIIGIADGKFDAKRK